MLLLAGMVTVGFWRVRDDQSRHESLNRSARTVAALEQAHANFFEEMAIVAALVWVQDPALATLYGNAVRELEQGLSLAQREALAAGDSRLAARLGFLTQRMTRLDQQFGPIVPALLGSDPEEAIDTAQAGMGPAQSETYLIRDIFEALVTEEQEEFAAKRAAADHSADVTLMLFVTTGLVALIGGTTAMAMLILSVVRPLASLQASARAITSGDLQTRAKVSGPEEVACLARDFNEMVTARRLAEYALRERTEVLAERAKELNCLYNLSDLAQKRDVSLPQILQATTDLLPPAWQYPEAACARIVFEGQVFATGNFRETRWRQASDIVVHGRPSGTVEIRYLDEKPEHEEGPFLDAERRLINAVAERLGHTIERKQAEEALQESEARYKALFAGAPEGMLVADLQTKQFRHANPAMCRMLGYTEEEFLRLGVADIHPKESLDYVLAEFEAQARGEKLLTPDLPCQRKDGSLFYANVSGIMVVLDGRNCNVGFFTDVTERRQAEEALRKSERELAIRNSVANIFLTVPDEQMYGEVLRVILETMESEHGVFGYIDDDGALVCPSLTKDVWDQCQMPGKDIVFPREVWSGIWGRALTEKKTLFSNRPAQVPEGHIAIRRVLAVPIVHHGEAMGLLMVANRATDYGEDDQELLEAIVHATGPILSARLERDRHDGERRRAEEALREQARRDPLTGVLNHAAVVAELRSLISSGGDGTSHTVAMADVDGLKAINDTYGHQVGDAVLIAVATALSRDGAVVGRYGGDEFTVILPGADRDAAGCYRDGVLGTLAGTRLNDPETRAGVPVSVSMGLATHPNEADKIEELIRLADSEMYAAKRQRPVGRASLATTDPVDADRAAKTLAEIAPLLTSPGQLNEKLRLVAHRLAVGAGYDGVHFQVLRHPSEAPAGQSAFAQAPDELVEAWNREQRQFEGHPLREILERTRRPIILDDVQNDHRLTDAERELLRAAGLRSALLVPMFWQNELLGHLSVASKREAAFGPSHARFLTGVAAGVASIVRTATLIEELKSTSGRLEEAHTETVMLLAAAAEAHDRTTGQHLQNVRAITEALAADLGHSDKEFKELGLASVLHDIGKVRVPDSILASVGRLTDEEWELMKHHTTWGAEFLVERPGFELAATIARSHHERWDGGGYPDGLAGKAIPEAAAIVAVADAFDAITSDRPYRTRRSVTAAMQEIMACSGGQFSPKVVQALVRLHKRKMLPRPHRYALGEKAVA